jgi:LPS export ABC transporter protein LptC
LEDLPENVDLALREVRFSETREGVRKWAMVADSAAYNAGSGVTSVENIRMTFFDRDGHETVKLNSRQGKVQTESGEVTLSGDVVMTSVRGYTIRTERLVYRKSDDVILGDTPVKFSSAWMELSGRKLRLQVQDQQMTLSGDVRTLIKGKQPRTGQP